MRIDCYKCDAVYEIPDESIGPAGVRAECPRCGMQETIRPDYTEVKRVLQETRSGPPGQAEDDRDSLFDFSGSGGGPKAPRAAAAGAGRSASPPPLPGAGAPKRAPKPATRAPSAGTPNASGIPSTDSPPRADDSFVSVPAPGTRPPMADAPSAEALPGREASAMPAPAAAEEDPFASLPSPSRPAALTAAPGAASAGDPFAEPAPPPAPAGGADPFAEPAPPPAPAGGADPFAAVDASASADPDPFADGPEPAGPVPAGAAAPPSPGATAGYRIKKLDGRILGPFNLEVLEEMAERGEIAPGDQVARGRDEFRLLSQYSECRGLLEKAANRYRVKGGGQPFRRERRRRWPLLVALAVVLPVAAGGALYLVRPDLLPDTWTQAAASLFDSTDPLPDNPVSAQLPLFRLQVLEVEGEPKEHIDRALSAMSADTSEAYARADISLKTALLLDPDDTETLGLLVVNKALRHGWDPGSTELQRLGSYARYLEAASPEEPTSLMARAAVGTMFGADAAEARRLAQAAVDARPGDGIAALILGRATAAVDDRAARSVLSELAARSDPPPRVYIELAGACQSAGDYQCARRALGQRIEIDPHHEEATALLVGLFVLVGRHDEARALYADLLRRRPDRTDAALALAMMDYQIGGRVVRARRTIERAIESRTGSQSEEIDRRLRVHGAAVARLAGDTARAGALLEEVFAEDPHHGPASYQAVLVALKEGRLEEASSHLPAAVAGMDEPARRFLLRALVLEARGNLEDASREARRAMDAWPEAMEPLLLAASLEGKRGQPRGAYPLIGRLLRIDPTEVHKNRELTDYWDGSLLESTMVDGFGALVESDPTQGMAHAGRGIARWLAGDTPGARSSLRQALRLDPQNFPALTFSGVLDYEAGRLRSALGHFERAARSDRLHPMPLYLTGRVHERRGARPAALEAYRDALRRDQAFHPAQIRQAVLRARAGDEEQAREVLRRLVVSRTGNVAARAALFEIGE